MTTIHSWGEIILSYSQINKGTEEIEKKISVFYAPKFKDVLTAFQFGPICLSVHP